jgi:hypothetical protein
MITAQLLDELLEQKLKSPEDRARVAGFASSYLRDRTRELVRTDKISKGEEMMFRRIIRILDAVRGDELDHLHTTLFGKPFHADVRITTELLESLARPAVDLMKLFEAHNKPVGGFYYLRGNLAVYLPEEFTATIEEGMKDEPAPAS